MRVGGGRGLPRMDPLRQMAFSGGDGGGGELFMGYVQINI